MPIVRLIGIVPIGIALTVLFFVWTQPYSGFGAMPIFFRVFASFICLGFLLVGSVFLFAKAPDPAQMRSMLANLKKSQTEESQQPDALAQPQQTGYQCSSCGAALDQDADVSPLGDAKCKHCGKWFNIHRTT